MRIEEARWIPTQIIQRGCETDAFAVSFLIEICGIWMLGMP
jgi:hypothetical protein